MEQAQKDIQEAITKTKEQVLNFVDESKKEVTEINPKEFGIAAGIALFISLTLHLATKQKEDSFITFGVFIYGLVTALCAVLLRKKHLNQQFPFMMVIFSFIRLFVDVSALSVIFLSASPVLVNIANEELKKKVNVQ